MPDDRFHSWPLDQIKQLVGIAGTPFEQRVSDLLVEQLREGLVTGQVHPEKVVHEIRCLEGMGDSKTEPEEPFRGGVLGGFSKKHFFMARYLPQNLINELRLNRPRSEKTKAVIRGARGKKGEDPAKYAMRIAQRLVENTYSERAKKRRLTGEWIVFKKHEGKTYYLTLAFHGEADPAIRDQVIFDRMVAGCSKQFPFLFAH